MCFAQVRSCDRATAILEGNIVNGRLRIVTALVFGALLVGGSYYLSSERKSSASIPDPRVEAVTASAPPRDFIEIEDADGNGIADWKETLPTVPDLAEKLAATSSSTASTTHTNELAIHTLQSMIQSGMTGAYQTNPSALALDAAAYMGGLATDELFTEADVKTSSDTSEAALRAYGNRVAEITEENAVQKRIDSEVAILGRALNANDPALLADLALIVSSYEGMVGDMRALSVPETYAKEHLDLLNTYNAILNDVRGMQHAFTDPIYALARFQRYEDDGKGLYQAISNLYLKLHKDGIRWTSDDAVSDFITIE